MKKTRLFLCFLCVLGLMAIFHTNTTANAAANISRGKWGEVDWEYNSETGALTFTGTGTAADTVNSWSPWKEKEVKTIEFQQPVKLQEHAALFAYMMHLQKIIGLDKLDTSNVKDMHTMFYLCEELEEIKGIGNWDVSKVEKMTNVFDGCRKLKLLDSLENWDISNVKEMTRMFVGCQELKQVDGLENWDVSNVNEMSTMFAGCSKLENLDSFRKWNIRNVDDLSGMFSGCESIINLDGLINWDISKVESLNTMFERCTKLSDIRGIENWNISSVWDLHRLFKECESLSDIRPLANWNIQNAEDAREIFSDCISLEDISALSEWDTSSMSAITYMFRNCDNLKSADALSKWQLPKIGSTVSMFENCPNLKSVNLESWNGQNIYPEDDPDYDPYYGGRKDMFEGCPQLSSITLGKDFNFIGYKSNIPELPDVDTTTGLYTGEWIGVNTKQIYASSRDFMDKYDGSMPDTYVWRRTPHQVNYQFVSETPDKELPAAVTDLLPSPISSSGALDSESIASPTLSATEITADDGVWTFKGWDQASVAVSQTDETVTGTWAYTKKPKVCSITYHSNYPSSTQRQLKEINELKLTLERPDAHMHTVRDPNQAELAYKMDGYKFKGWNTQRDGSGKSYAVGDKIQMSGTIDLYAQWEAIQDVTEPGKDDPTPPTPPTSPTPPTTSSTTPPVTPPTTPPTSPANPKAKEPNPFVNHTTTTMVNGKGAPKLLPATGDDVAKAIWELCGGTVLLAVSYLFYQRRRKNSD